MASHHGYRFSTPPISYVTSVESGGGDSSHSCVRVLPRRHASLAAGILKFFLKLTVSDIAIYNVRRTRPSLNATACDIVFDPHLDSIPHAALAAFFVSYRGIVVYTAAYAMYHILMPVGRVLL